MGGTQTGCVDKAKLNTIDDERVFNQVACGAVNIAHDSFLFAEKCIQQGRFAGIRSPYYRYGDTVFDGVTHAETANQFAQMLRDRLRQLPELTAVGKLQLLVVGKIEFKLDE